MSAQTIGQVMKPGSWLKANYGCRDRSVEELITARLIAASVTLPELAFNAEPNLCL